MNPGDFDLALLYLCLLAAVAGSIAHAIVLSGKFDRTFNPSEQVKITWREISQFMGWLFCRLIIGALVGLMVAAYFVGAVKEDVSTLGKLFAFSMALGFAAPRFWSMQERLAASHVETLATKGSDLFKR